MAAGSTRKEFVYLVKKVSQDLDGMISQKKKKVVAVASALTLSWEIRQLIPKNRRRSS